MSGATASTGGAPTRRSYTNGRVAAELDGQGVGYVYYPCGQTAVCVSPASDYQNRFFAFDKSGKASTVLLGVDEFAVGFASSSKRKSAAVEPVQCALSKHGAVVSEGGTITKEWRWDNKDGSAPVAPVIMNLNEYITFKVLNKKVMHLEFNCENIKLQLDMGVKQRRETTYLDHATRDITGKVEINFKHQTLKERQTEFNEAVKFKRNKVHPRSEQLPENVSGIVRGLEQRFDTIASSMHISPSFDSTWKKTSLDATIRELPKIPISGTETGLVTGFAEQLYVTMDDTLRTTMSQSLAKKVTPSDVAHANPPLKRPGVLNRASGRYSSMLVVDKDKVTLDNPSGGAELIGTALAPKIWLSDEHRRGLKDEIKGTSPNSITVGLLVEENNPECIAIERVAEVANFNLQNSDSTKTYKQISLVRLSISDNRTFMAQFGIKSLPTFVVFRGGELAYAGPLGGRKFKLESRPRRLQVLLIEPNFKAQIRAEKLLKGIHCDTFLCVSVAEGTQRIRQMSMQSNNQFVFDIVLISELVDTASLSDLLKALNENVTKGKTVVSLMVAPSEANLKAVDWTSHYSTEVNKLVSNSLLYSIRHAILHPVKAAAVERLSRLLRGEAEAEAEFGLTPETLITRINEVSEGNFNATQNSSSKLDGSREAYVGIRLSAEDVTLRTGQKLVPQTYRG